MKNKIVKIIGSKSIPECFLGQYGKILGHAYRDKWEIELKATTEKTGALIHTVSEQDFDIIGENY